MATHVVHLHVDAPPKPTMGEPCNGCGVCCAAETCPVGRLVFQRKNGPCPALVWLDAHYACGLAVQPGDHVRFLPRRLNPLAAKLVRRWIAAGKACDSAVEIVNPR